VWDLGNAVVAQAIDVLYHQICRQYSRSKVGSDQDFLISVAYHCNQTPAMLLAYFEILFIELGYANQDLSVRRIVKLLEKV